MDQIPSWVIYSAGAFFVLGTVFLIALIGAVIVLIKLALEMKPKVDALQTSVQGLIVKVQGVAERVEEVATSVKQTVDNVGDKAKHVAGSADVLAQTAGRQFGRYSPYVVGVMTAFKLFNSIQDLQRERKEKAIESRLKKVRGKSSLVGRLLRLL